MHRFYIEEKNGVSIIDSIPHCHTENALKRDKSKKCGFFFIYSGKMEYLSSIVFHTVILKMLSKKAKSRNVASFLYTGEFIIDCIPHCHTENAFTRDKKKTSRNVASFLCRIQNWSMYHRYYSTLSCFQKGTNQEMWLRFYIVEQRSMYHR